MNIIVFSYFFPPDLSAGAFRTVALVEALSNQLRDEETIHVVSTHPNRYESYIQEAKSFTNKDNVFIYRVKVPQHRGRTLGQIRSFSIYFIRSFFIAKKIKPDFMFCTTGRHMTSAMTWIFSLFFKKRYFVDFRDIFSEGISDIYGRYNQTLGLLMKKIFLLLEKNVLKKATGVNVVSEAFLDYYRKADLDVSSWTFYPNGVDIDFINIPKSRNRTRKEKVVLYAGNVGKGQGLEIIIPDVARRLKGAFKFIVIGDGGMKPQLANIIKKYEITNILLKDPVSRHELIQEYLNADILFLQLNTLSAFERSLPSKLFEYAVIGKPIVGGLSGYSKDFVLKNIPHGYIFNPGDVQGCINCLKRSTDIQVEQEDIQKFIKKYSRDKIMYSFSKEILQHAKSNPR